MLWNKRTVVTGLRRAVMALALVCLLPGPSGAGETWTASYQFPPGDPRDDAMRQIARRMAEGGVTIRLFPSASLLRPNDQWDAMLRGSVHMVFVPADYLLDRFPQMAALSLPGAIRTQAQAERVQASPVMAEFHRRMEAAGVMVLADTWSPGAYATRKGCVLAPADAKGLKARTIGAFMSALWNAAGAIPVPATTSDTLPQLVRNGLVDVANTSLTTLSSLRMEESFKCVVLPGRDGALWYLYEPILISKQRFDALDESGRQRLRDAAAAAQRDLAVATPKLIDLSAERFLAAGAQVRRLEGGELLAWHSLARRTAWTLYRDTVVGGGDILDQITTLGDAR